MNNYFFDRANAVDRENRIREEAQAQQTAAQHSQNVNQPETEHILISPRYRRAVTVSFFVVMIGVLLLLITPVSAQSWEPQSGGGDAHGEALFVFTMGNIAYVRENYAEAVVLFEEAISMIPQEIFELDSNFAHMYAYLGRAQLALELDEAAIESLTLYIEYAGEDALPEIVAYVAAYSTES